MTRKKKRSLVIEVALADRENFKVLPNRKEAKNIYDKIRNRLTRQGYSGELLENKMLGEIRSELFTLQKPYEPKQPEKPKPSANPVRDDFMIKGYDLWGEHEETIDPIDQLQRDYNESVAKGFRDAFCSRCKSNPCTCRYEGDG